jgi:hypothetical protein
LRIDNGRKQWWARQDSNLQPDRYERSALTIELQARATRARVKQTQDHTALIALLTLHINGPREKLLGMFIFGEG